MLELFRLIVQAGCLLLLAAMVLLSLPQSRLRDFLAPLVYGGFALLCGVYVLSPVDVVPEIAFGPFGLIDDAGILVAGILSARAAMRKSLPSRH